LRLRAVLLVAAGALALAAPAHASGPPTLGAAWSSGVQTDSARITAEINPNGLSTSYHVEYVTDALFEQNGFSGASKAPPVNDSNIGSGTSLEARTQQLAGLQADTVYHYRVAAKNGGSSPNYVFGAAHTFRTLNLTVGTLPDSRGWEMVSPIEKNGGLVDGPGLIAGGGVLQAGANGETVTYSSTSSFSGGGQGAPQASQYISHRTAVGWTTENITAPVVSGSYSSGNGGVPYQIFSDDLGVSVLFNGDHCRGIAGNCGVANPPISGTGAPASFQNFYLRTTSPAGFESLIGGTDLGHTGISAAKFDVRLAGISQNVEHIAITTCAALTRDAIEVPAGEGCDPEKQNLYEWSAGGGLKLVNILPSQSQGKPGAILAAQAAALSNDGSRVYWSDLETGNLYLREGSQTKTVETGTTSFQTASPDGAVAFFTRGEHLYRYDATGSTSADLTPSGGVKGVLGASATGNVVYYTTSTGISVWNGTTSTVASGAADDTNFPPASGTARVSPNGQQLLFLSKASLTGYDNVDLNTGTPDSEVFLYDSTGSGSVTCVSCNPTNERPLGASAVPGAVANGTAAYSTDVYKPRVLSSNGRRVFFETRDSLASSDTNSGAPDVYEWEANSSGSCSRPEGCVSLISSGRSAGGANVIDASADGSDVFFTTDASLVGTDPGSIDLYDARVGGGFPEQTPDIDCEGDACTPLPETPIDPTLTTLTAGRGNPAKHYFCLSCKKHHKKKHHKKKHHKRGNSRTKGVTR
jgi:hypothetical protein